MQEWALCKTGSGGGGGGCGGRGWRECCKLTLAGLMELHLDIEVS